jgi:hypothetical protein
MTAQCARLDIDVCPQNALAMRAFCAHIAHMSYVDNIIDAFGGVRPLASIIGKAPSTVQSWKDRRSIPDDHKSLIWAKAQECGVSLVALDFVPFSAPHPTTEGSAAE